MQEEEFVAKSICYVPSSKINLTSSENNVTEIIASYLPSSKIMLLSLPPVLGLLVCF